MPLRLSARILRLAILVEASDVADADAVGIATSAMSANLLDGPTLFDTAISPYDIMIANALPASLLVPSVDVGSTIVLALNSGTAMNDDFSDCSHTFDVKK